AAPDAAVRMLTPKRNGFAGAIARHGTTRFASSPAALGDHAGAMSGLDVVVQALLSGLFMGSVYALIAIGFTLVFGVTDIVNFAHGHLVMAAMFVTYFLFKPAHPHP